MPRAPERASKGVAALGAGGVGCPREAETWASGFSSDCSDTGAAARATVVGVWAKLARTADG